jgi:hypothetical protein
MTEALSLLIKWASNFPNCKGITAKGVLATNTGWETHKDKELSLQY